MTEAGWLAALLAEASADREKLIASDWQPGMDIEHAVRELRKYLHSRNRGESALRLVELVCKYGHKDVLRAGFERELRDVRPSDIIERVEHVGDQLELFGAEVRAIKRLIEDSASVLPFERRK